MATGKITLRSVAAQAPAKRDNFLWDDKVRGFGLKVTPAGARTYIFQYRMGGRSTPTRRVTLGPHGSLTPDIARGMAERLYIQVRQGNDPVSTVREKRRVSVELEFEAFANRFLDDYIAHNWKASSVPYARRILRRYVVPSLKGRSLTSITRADINKLIDSIPPEQAALRASVYSIAGRLFRWAVGRGIETSPMEGTEPPKKPAARDRTLNDEELRCAWLATFGLNRVGAIYRLLMLTAQRKNEVAHMDWAELDRAAAEWIIPKERAKNGVATIIHLSPVAISELDALARGEKWPRAGLVVPSTRDGKPYQCFDYDKKKIDKEAIRLLGDHIPTWTIHDLRRTAATGLQRLGVRFEVVESILNHVSGAKSGVAGVYQRHDWKDEKRAALDAWASHIERLAGGGGDRSNVISFEGKRA